MADNKERRENTNPGQADLDPSRREGGMSGSGRESGLGGQGTPQRGTGTPGERSGDRPNEDIERGKHGRPSDKDVGFDEGKTGERDRQNIDRDKQR